MNLILTLLFNLILFNGCLPANIDRELSRSEVQQQNKSDKILNEEFIFPIFDTLDLEEIIKFEKNSRVSSFVKEIIFPAKFKDNKFQFYAYDAPQRGRHIYDFTHQLQMFGYEFTMDFIKTFGRSIQNLVYFHTEHQLNDEQAVTVFRNINEHCSDKLRLLSLKYITENALMEFKKPFRNVDEFSLQTSEQKIKSFLPIDEMFPKLQRLTLNLIGSAPDNEFLDRTIPNLQHLEIPERVIEPIHYKQFESFFRKNPQIRSLAYGHYLGDFIQVINNFLPNLEHFAIKSLDSNVQSVQLDHVKYFSVIDSNIASLFERLFIPRLESLSMPYHQQNGGNIISRDSWITFFKNHQNIREINCTAFADIELPKFLTELPNLTKIRIISFQNFGINFISGIIENNKNLLSLQYEVIEEDHPEVSDLESYIDKYGNNWNVIHYISESVSIYNFQKQNDPYAIEKIN